MQAKLRQVPLVFVCYVGTARPVQVRLMIRRIRRIFPAAKVVIGLWRMPSNGPRFQEVKSAVGSDAIASTLTEALDYCAAEIKAPVDPRLEQTKHERAGEHLRDEAVSGPHAKNLISSSQHR